MDFRSCESCRQNFWVRPQVPKQHFCSKAECQRDRRRQTQIKKRQSDPDYQDDQLRAQQAWVKRNPNYWREYRKTHSKYVERNRLRQRERNKKRIADVIAKMDSSKTNSSMPSGIYRLTPVSQSGIAKMDVWTVEIKFISNTSDGSSALNDDCKEKT